MRRVLASAAAALCLVGCGGNGADDAGSDREPAREKLSIATGGRGGIYAVYGAELARLITRRLDGYRGSASATSGSVENLQRLRDGKSQIALTLGDTALDAVEGREAFDRPVPMRALAQIYPSYIQLVTKADAGIATLADLEGKRVSVGLADSGTQVVAERVLDVAGIDPRTAFESAQLGVAESAQALEQDAIDAFFWSGGVPTRAVTELARRSPVALVDLRRFARAMRTRWGGVYENASIPAGVYGLRAPVATISIPNYIVVDEHMDTGLAYDLTKLVHDSAGAADRARAQRVIAPVGLHPGAQDYYDRAGP
jgi:TRAP transporter TAXI family solute receptor